VDEIQNSLMLQRVVEHWDL